MEKINVILLISLVISGCASVPMESEEQNTKAKLFNPPSSGKSGVYIYRPSSLGAALKKDILIDSQCVGESAPYVFFYTEVAGNAEHTISTESEFSPNNMKINSRS